MSGTTGGGLPYPTGTDKVRDGDNAIQALAEGVDARIWAPTLSKRVRFFAGMWATGTDGRVWIPAPGLTTVSGAVGSIPGPSRWVTRPYQYSGGSVLWEVTDMNGATINSIAMTFAMTVWGD